MGQTSGQIEQHIYEQRGELGEKIDALQQKVKSAVDWRQQTCARPFTAIAIAFGGGILLAALLPSRNSLRGRFRTHERTAYPGERFSATQQETQQEKERASGTWDKIKAALISVAASQLQDILSEAVPGFRGEFSRTEARRTSSATHKAPELAEAAYRQKANGPTSDWSTHS